ncbi:unnamed protein product [Ectocarpus fasciculatus]
MPLLEEVDPEAGDPAEGAEGLKAAHRRRRASKKKKRADGAAATGAAAFRVFFEAAVVLGVGFWARSKGTDSRSNSCKMTFSRPEYVHLPVAGYPAGEAAGDEVPGYQYRLMRYMDRALPASEKADPLKPKGIPVLFIPGHLGSYEQARSLGSQAAGIKLSGPMRRLDVFSLDFLEEPTALHGSLVWRHAEFLNHAVEAILALYTGKGGVPSADSVMVVAHSLGGVVTRAAFTLPSYRVGSITDIITLGSPHERPPWGMDYSYLSLYKCTDSLWRWHSSPSPSPSPSDSRSSHCWSGSNGPALEISQSAATDEGPHQEACFAAGDESETAEGGCSAPPGTGGLADGSALEAAGGGSVAGNSGWGGSAGVDAEGLLGDTVLLGVSGGLKDFMVHTSLCETDGLGLEGQSASFTTAAMEKCGFGVDHLALVWCKQLIGRVVATLSELELLDRMGAGAKERTRVAAGVLASLPRSSEATASGDHFPRSAGFEEAYKAGDEMVMVARSLVSDRILLFIPAWVYVACLVLAAALTRGLCAKTAKEGVLLPVPLLLTPDNHFQLGAVRYAWRSLWASIRAKGRSAIAGFWLSCGALLVWMLGDDIAAYFPGPIERLVDVVCSVPGGAVGLAALRWVNGTASSLIRALNPLDGAGDALRLHPAKGMIALYTANAGWMVVFVYMVTLLGVVGNGARGLVPVPAALRRLLRSPKVAAVAVLAAVVAAHVETFSLPPTFREVTMKSELSIVFMLLSISLYALLGSLVLFPSHAPAAANHQHLVVFLFAPINALLNGPQIAATGILLRRQGSSHEPFVAPSELALASLALLPIIASVWLARRARPFPSPPGMHAFWAEFQFQLAEEVARANGGSIAGGGANGTRSGGTAALAAAALERPNGHGACGKCLHADGGESAVFMETDREKVRVGPGVSLGPGFRVVACDCPQRERASPSTWCEFCRCVCKACGGCKEAVRATRGGGVSSRGGGGGAGGGGGGTQDLSDALGAAASAALVSVLVLYVGLWAFGMRMMAVPCHGLIALAVIGAVLCGMHWGVQKDAASGRRKSS